jgi:hypothetical protein
LRPRIKENNLPDFEKARGKAGMEGSSKKATRLAIFCPTIRLRDGESKYLVFLNPESQLVTINLHEWIPVGEYKSGKTQFESFIDRRDPVIGEDEDELTDRLGVASKKRTLGVAVELEPKFEVQGNGRKKATGFEVKLESYTRTNEEGEDEEVQAPVVGLVIQSKANFYGTLASYDEAVAPIEELPVQVVRRGGDKETAYDFVPFPDTPVDYSNLFEYLDGVGYLRGSGIEPVGKTEQERAVDLGNKFLDHRLEQLADSHRYTDLVSPIRNIVSKYGSATPAKAIEVEDDDEYEAPVESKVDKLRRQMATR